MRLEYPYYETCQGCNELLNGNGTNEGIEIIGIKIPNGVINYIEVYCHRNCREKAEGRIKEKMKENFSLVFGRNHTSSS
jgi:hypothetical protein